MCLRLMQCKNYITIYILIYFNLNNLIIIYLKTKIKKKMYIYLIILD